MLQFVNRQFSLEERSEVRFPLFPESKALAALAVLSYCESLARNGFAPEVARPSPGSHGLAVIGRVGKTFKA